ncbi:unnamed protein product, partial [Rotaria sp. Silwood1]
MPVTGRIDSFNYETYFRMISELECISICLQYSSPLCYAISYESFRQECRIITESVSSSFIPNQLYLDWQSTFEDLHQYKEAVDRSRRAFGCDHAEVKVNQGDLDLLNWIN